jgi:hypothetical protein
METLAAGFEKTESGFALPIHSRGMVNKKLVNSICGKVHRNGKVFDSLIQENQSNQIRHWSSDRRMGRRDRFIKSGRQSTLVIPSDLGYGPAGVHQTQH